MKEKLERIEKQLELLEEALAMAEDERRVAYGTRGCFIMCKQIHKAVEELKEEVCGN